MFLKSNTVPVSFLHRLVENCAGSVLREWILEVREVISEMKICCTHFEKWKVKWKSDSLFSRSEKWNENASRSRSRNEISREFSRIQNFLKILEKLTKTKKEESFQIQTIFLPTFSFWVHFGATSIFGKVFIWGGMVCDKCQMVPPTLLQWCNFMHISL